LRAAEERDPELAAFLRPSAATGARRSELVALRGVDVSFDRSVVAISRGIVLGLDCLVEKDTKTHQSRRVILDRATPDALSSCRGRACERNASFGLQFGRECPHFTSDLGATPWYPDSVSRRFRAVAKRWASTGFGCTTCVTTWPRGCSRQGWMCERLPVASDTATPQ